VSGVAGNAHPNVYVHLALAVATFQGWQMGS
jgi:hypothetical protein